MAASGVGAAVLTAAPVDVWYLPLGAVPGSDRTRALAGLLGDDELRRVERLVEPAERRRLLVSHGLTRMVLARYTRTGPSALAWSIGGHGKPGPVGAVGPVGPVGAERPVHWNLSHSGDHGLLAVSAEFELGVDVQTVSGGTAVLALARRFLSPDEYAEVAAQRCAAGRQSAYHRALCRREARAKADGGRLLDLLGRGGDRPGGRIWTVRDLPAPAGCVAALATPADRPRRVRRLDWHWPTAARTARTGGTPRTSTLLTPKGFR